MNKIEGPRRLILQLLADQPQHQMSATRMLEVLPDLPSKSHHVRLKRMEKDGWLTSETRKIPGERNRPRRFYKLTPIGFDVLKISRQQATHTSADVASDQSLVGPYLSPSQDKTTRAKSLIEKLPHFTTTVDLREGFEERSSRFNEIVDVPDQDARIKQLDEELSDPQFSGYLKAFRGLNDEEANSLLFWYIKKHQTQLTSMLPTFGIHPREAVPKPQSPADTQTNSDQEAIPETVEGIYQALLVVWHKRQMCLRDLKRYQQRERRLLDELPQVLQIPSLDLPTDIETTSEGPRVKLNLSSSLHAASEQTKAVKQIPHRSLQEFPHQSKSSKKTSSKPKKRTSKGHPN